MLFSVRTRRSLPAALILLLSLGAAAQTLPAPSTPTQANRILPQPDLSRATRLSGYLPPWVNPTADAGAVPDDTPLRITLVLSRTPALRTAFDQLLADQQNPASPRFHQWLTPTQIGEQFGPTLDDVHAITAWLTTSGLHLAELSPARTILTVTGTAGTAAATFVTSFRQFTLDGQPHLAATSEPTIPTAFAEVIASIQGLSDTPVHPMVHTRPAQPRAAPGSLEPLYSDGTNTVHYIFPGDFQTIYNITPTLNSGYDGRGTRIAVIGRSQIANSDITQLENLANIFPARTPTVVLVPGSADPGIVAAETDESTLDVGRVLTTALGAPVDLVIAASASGGIAAAIQYNINTLQDPVMTISYGACESAAGASGVNFYNTLFAQAAAQGMSIFASSGDAAAAGCSANFSTPKGTETLGMGNYICSNPYVTCVGGTQFNDANPAAYWAPGQTTAPYASALGSIPEGAWNEPTATNSSGATVFQIAGTGSGPSAYIPKPSWQIGVGVPADGARDIPDVAFTSSSHDGIFGCLAYLGAAADCSQGHGIIFYGTSAAAPSMAAIAAILDQRLGHSQGNLNPLLYKLAASTPAAFHDATPASSGVAGCTTATATICNNSVASPTTISGGLAGYPLQVGYDLATGLGSLDVTRFINASVTAALSVSSVAVVASPTAISAGQSATFTATVSSAGMATPTGTIQFFSNGTAISQVLSLTNGTAATPAIVFPTAGTFSITAVYSGDSASAGSTSTPISFVVTALPATITVAGSTATTLTAGQTTTVLSASVTSATGTGATPTGSVQFNVNGKFLAGPLTLTAGKATSSPLVLPTSGRDTITAVYSGDASYAPSTSAPINVLVNPVATAVTLTAAPANPIAAGATATFSATITFTGAGTPTGTVQFAANGTPFGPAIPLSGTTAQTTTFNTRIAGSYAITASYSGDATFASSISPAVSVVVAQQPTAAGLALAASPSTLALSSAAANTATSAITATTPNSFTGTATLGCVVAPTTGVPPTCSLSATTLTFTSAQSAASTLTVATIAPHNRPGPGTLARSTPGATSLKGISLAALLLALLPAARRRRLYRSLPRLLTVLLAATLLSLSGCGGSGSTVSSPPPPVLTGTTPGAYTVTVTATSGASVATTTINVTVQ